MVHRKKEKLLVKVKCSDLIPQIIETKEIDKLIKNLPKRNTSKLIKTCGSSKYYSSDNLISYSLSQSQV